MLRARQGLEHANSEAPSTGAIFRENAGSLHGLCRGYMGVHIGVNI